MLEQAVNNASFLDITITDDFYIEYQCFCDGIGY